jgi:uncharacterized membrane protein
MLNAEMNSEFTSAFTTQNSELRISPRRDYIDALRGLAVLIMIEAHVLDSWTRFPDRQTRHYAYAMVLGGFGAPLFLFLAGLVVPLSAGSKLRKTGNVQVASRVVARRGLEIFGLAFLFRIQAWVLGWSAPRWLLRVDILNIMGPSIMAAAAIWGALNTLAGRLAAFAAATLAIALTTPIVRNISILSPLPDPIEAYLRPAAGLSNFAFFPWAGFVFAGALAGLVLDAARSPRQEQAANLGFALIGTGIATAAYALSFRPTWYPQSHFWTTSPAFFFMRLGIMTAALGFAYAWELRPGGGQRWTPLGQLGRTSLFIYWIHVEIVYGLISLPLHKRLSWGQSWLALALFWVLMLLCSIAKDRVVERWAQGSRLRVQARSLAKDSEVLPEP